MLPRGLSMLWEASDPEQELRRRFGFEDFEAVTNWTRDVAAKHWGLRVLDCPRMVISSHNAIVWIRSREGDWVMKWSGAHPLFPRLEHSTELMARLAARGLPVVAPRPVADGRVRVVLDGSGRDLSVCILPEVAGDWLDVGDAEAVRAAGASLADLHEALCAEPVQRVPAPLRSGLRNRVEDWLAHADHGREPLASGRLRALLAAAPQSDEESWQAPRQLLHGDFRAANILTRDSGVVAVLDFDDVEVGTRVDELARSAVHLRTRFHMIGCRPLRGCGTCFGPAMSRSARSPVRRVDGSRSRPTGMAWLRSRCTAVLSCGLRLSDAAPRMASFPGTKVLVWRR